MYIALVMACLAYDPSYCKILEDQLGPYKTYEQCEERALAMGRMVYKHMPGYKAVRWKCRPAAQGQLSSQWQGDQHFADITYTMRRDNLFL